MNQLLTNNSAKDITLSDDQAKVLMDSVNTLKSIPYNNIWNNYNEEKAFNM